VLERLQHELFALGAELATPDPVARGVRWIGAAHIAALEADIDHWEATLSPLQAFILPAGSAAAAALHLARCICRRAERRLVTLMHHEKEIGGDALVYLNRLSDLLFVLARAANHLLAVPDVAWRKPQGPP
jgi:cob(I)alamin adenosyltransferase